MSGIEPESERIFPQTSTSVVDSALSPDGPKPTKETSWLSAKTRKPLFRMVSGMAHAALIHYDARHYLREESGVSGRGPTLEDQPLS
jgi:hypothetical protein